ncbi:MAG: hypothetical protein HZA54_14900 [Planctomycetes bacterium]|nr:hypothetical protein [Planctomycetota bacterium]
MRFETTALRRTRTRTRTRTPRAFEYEYEYEYELRVRRRAVPGCVGAVRSRSRSGPAPRATQFIASPLPAC